MTVAVSVTVSVTVSASVSVSEGRVCGSDRGSEHTARPWHGHLRVVHTDRSEKSVEPKRHGAHIEGTEPTHPHRNHEGSKTRRNHEARPPTRPESPQITQMSSDPPAHPKTQRREGAKTQRGWCRDGAPFRLVAAERQAIGSPAAGKKRTSSERERSSPPRFSPATVPGARRFCLSLFPSSAERTAPSPSS